MLRLYTLNQDARERELDSFEQAKAYMKETSLKEEVAMFALEDSATYRYFVGVDGRIYTPKSLRRFHRGNDLFHIALALTPSAFTLIYNLTRSEPPALWWGLLLGIATAVVTVVLVVERTRRKVVAKMLEELVADAMKQADPQLQAKGLQPQEA